MKKSIFIKAFTAVLLTAALASCSFMQEVEPHNSVSSDTDDKALGYITVGNTTCARSSIVPESDSILLSKLTNVGLICVWGSNTGSPVTKYITGTTWSEFIEQFASPGYPLQTGTYSFTLTANLDGVSFQGIKNDNITAGETKTLNFTLKPWDTTNNAEITTGGLNITWNLTGTPDYATITLSGSDPVNITSFPDNKLTYTKSELAAGEYDLTVDFKSSDETLPTLSTWSGKVRVVSGITTTAEIDWAVDTTTYDITWELNEGTAEGGSYVFAEKYTRKSETITLPTLTKAGYTFDGWVDETSTAITEITKGSAGNKTLTAQFTAHTDTPYVVKHWKQKVNGNANSHNATNYELVSEDDTESKTGTTDEPVEFELKDTSTTDETDPFYGFNPPSSSEITAAQALTILPNGTQEVNLYYPRHVTTVSYDDNVASQTISVPASTTPHYGQTVTISNTEPARTGYTFTGWTTVAEPTPSDTVYKKGTEHTSITAGLNNVTFYAQWSINSYEVSFETNGGSEVATQTVIYNNYAEEPSPAPTKPNYIFAGWYKDEGLQDVFTFSTTQVYNAITLYAKWNPIYTKIEVKNGNTVISSNYYSTLEATMQAIENIPDQKDVTITYYAAVENADNIGRINQPSTILGALCVYDSANSRYRFNSVSVIVEESADIVFTSNQFADFFSGQGNLVSVDLSGITTNNITDIQCMFKGCENLTSVTFGETFSTSNVSNMTQLFCHCTNLTTVDITSFRADSLQYTEQMFAYCTNLESIYVSSTFDLSSRSLTDSGMFMDCSTNLQGTKGTVWTSDKTGKDYARIDGGTSTPGYFSRKPYPVGSIVLKDGTIIPYTESLELTATQKSNAIAVIFYDGKASDTLGAKTLGIGLKMSRLKMTLEKDPNNGTISVVGYNTKLTSDDNDGKVFLQAIQECSDYEEHAEDYYPAIYWVANYKNQVSNLSGSSYDTGWYIPAKNEMLYVYNNVAKINEAFLKINESIEVFDYGQDGESQTGNYWTAVQDPNYGYECGIFKFWVSNGNGNLYDAKDYGAIVKKPFATAIHEF